MKSSSILHNLYGPLTFLKKSLITFLTAQLYKYAVPYKYNRHLWRNIFKHIYVCTRSLVFLKESFLWSLALFFGLKNNSIQAKIIPFSESTFKTKVVLGRKLFLILLTSQLIFKKGLICINLFSILFFYIHFLQTLENVPECRKLSTIGCRDLVSLALVS